MTSAINPLNPTAVLATTASVRANFSAAKTEIEALQGITPSVSITNSVFGAVGNDIVDDHAALQTFLNIGGRLILDGNKTYRNLSANLLFVANTELYIQKGTTLHLDTTRLTALNVNNVQIFNSGKISSTSLNTSDALPTNWSGRGIVEFGGTFASPVQNVGIDGPGEVYGDFAGTPGTGPVIGVNDKRRGIFFQNVQCAWAKFNNVHHVIAEAIYHNGTSVDYDIDVDFNRIHDCNHDAISPNQNVVPSFRTRGNIGWNCLNGIEGSVGDHQFNLMYDMIGSGYGFGGNTPTTTGSPVIYSNNTGRNNATGDFAMTGATAPAGTLVFQNNTSYNAGLGAFAVSFVTNLICTGNKAFGWGRLGGATGLAVGGNVTNAIVDDNAVMAEGASSSGGYNVAATGQLIWGENHAIGVAVPYANFASAGQKIKAALSPVYSRVGASSHTGDTNPFTLGTYTIPGNMFGQTGGVKVIAGGTITGTANTKTVNLTYGGTNFCQAVIPAAATGSWRIEAELYNVGVTNSQAFSNVTFAGTALIATSSGTIGIDSTIDKDIVLSVTNQNAGDTLLQNIFMVSPIIGFVQ